MAPNQREQIARLTAENTELKSKIALLTERLDRIEAAQVASEACNGEALVRLEGVEDNLCQLSAEQQELQHDQASLMLRLEAQEMYSRKQTLLLTGPAICPPTRGEDIRSIVVGLLGRHLGISGIQPKDICACHRLKNPRVILVRFVYMDHSDMVYRARTKPKQRGLLIFESLTSERLSVIRMLKDLKDSGTSKVLSYYTQSGKIFVRTSENKGVKPIEIPFGLDQGQIRKLCEGQKADPSPTTVRDQFRAVHSKSFPELVSPNHRPRTDTNPWVPVLSRHAKRAARAVPGSSGGAINGDKRSDDDSRETTGTQESVTTLPAMTPAAAAPSSSAGQVENSDT